MDHFEMGSLISFIVSNNAMCSKEVRNKEMTQYFHKIQLSIKVNKKKS